MRFTQNGPLEALENDVEGSRIWKMSFSLVKTNSALNILLYIENDSNDFH